MKGVNCQVRFCQSFFVRTFPARPPRRLFGPGEASGGDGLRATSSRRRRPSPDRSHRSGQGWRMSLRELNRLLGGASARRRPVAARNGLAERGPNRRDPRGPAGNSGPHSSFVCVSRKRFERRFDRARRVRSEDRIASRTSERRRGVAVAFVASSAFALSFGATSCGRRHRAWVWPPLRA